MPQPDDTPPEDDSGHSPADPPPDSDTTDAGTDDPALQSASAAASPQPSASNGNGHADADAIAASDPVPGPNHGGTGDFLSDPKHMRRDMRLIETALRRRWNTQDKIKDLLLNKVAAVGLNAKNPRWLMRAAYVWLAAERQNMADEHVLMPQQHLHAHVDATALAAVSQLPLEDLRALRRIHGRLRDQAGQIEANDGNGNGNGHVPA